MPGLDVTRSSIEVSVWPVLGFDGALTTSRSRRNVVADVRLARLRVLDRADDVDGVADLQRAGEELVRVARQLDDAVRAVQDGEQTHFLGRAEALA